MATKETALYIVRDIHGSSGHEGQKKMHQKIMGNFANTPRKIVVGYIKQCKRSVEKLKRR